MANDFSFRNVFSGSSAKLHDRAKQNQPLSDGMFRFNNMSFDITI